MKPVITNVKVEHSFDNKSLESNCQKPSSTNFDCSENFLKISTFIPVAPIFIPFPLIWFNKTQLNAHSQESFCLVGFRS